MRGSKHSISPEGRAKAEAELQHLREVRRPKIVAEIRVAREFGDLSENAEYHAAREAQGLNEARIRVLAHHLATATAQEGASGDSIGSRTRLSTRPCAWIVSARAVTSRVNQTRSGAAVWAVSIRHGPLPLSQAVHWRETAVRLPGRLPARRCAYIY
jgi:hypothetical protein